MKLEETENLKLQYVNRIETNTTHISSIQDSDTDLIEKITEILNHYNLSTISFHRDYVKVIPLTIDATPLNYNTFYLIHEITA